MISPLRQSDEVSVRPWARAYLRFTIRERAAAYDVDLTRGGSIDADAAIDEHIDDKELESALWHDIVHADYSESEFVGVARRGNQPLGLILVTTQIEPYLRIPVGVLRWIYVIESERRKGVGQQLINAADAWMARHGIEAREALVPAGNSARLLYEAIGFDVTELLLAAGAPGAD